MENLLFTSPTEIIDRIINTQTHLRDYAITFRSFLDGSMKGFHGVNLNPAEMKPFMMICFKHVSIDEEDIERALVMYLYINNKMRVNCLAKNLNSPSVSLSVTDYFIDASRFFESDFVAQYQNAIDIDHIVKEDLDDEGLYDQVFQETVQVALKYHTADPNKGVFNFEYYLDLLNGYYVFDELDLRSLLPTSTFTGSRS